MSFRRMRAVARKEFLHILRDSRSLAMALALPMIMLLLFGWALSLDVDRIPTIVYDLDKTPQSRDLIREFSGSRYFQIVGYAGRPSDIDRLIDRDEALLSILIAPGFARDLLSGREAQVQLAFDGSDSNTASIALGYAQALTQTYALALRSDAQQKLGAGALHNPVETRVRVWYNTDLKSKNYIIPGLIAVILMIIAALLTSLTIAREWENGTMEQLLSTPVRPGELVLGKLSAYFTLGVVDLLICIVVGVFIFEVPLRGDILLLFATCCIFLFGALSWGVMISAATRSQLMAYQLGVLTSFLPAFLLSGFVYAIENMPQVVQAVTYIVPARYFITALRALFLKGVGWSVVWTQLAFLVAYAAIVFAFASKKMRQKVA
jgi:ABC-2 type transport system permease protein